MVKNMEFSSGNNDKNVESQGIREAPGASDTVLEGSLIDMSGSPKQTAMETSQDDLDLASHKDISESKEKTSIMSNVMGLFRGSPQKTQTTNSEQHLKMWRKLEEEVTGLRQAHEKLQAENGLLVKTNKQLGSKINNTEEKYQTAKKIARNDVARLEHEINSGKLNNEHLHRCNRHAQNEILQLQSGAHTAEENFQTAKRAALKEINRLSSEVDAVRHELETQREDACKEIARLHDHVKNINDKNDKLRQMLIPVSEKQVLDGDVVQKFISLRSNILALVRRTWTLELRRGFDIRSLSRGNQAFFLSDGPGSYDRLRYLVFSSIYQGIFNPPNYFLRDDFEELEDKVQMVERDLINILPLEDRKLVKEWRDASFKATETIRGDGRTLSRDTQVQIWNFLDPLRMVDSASEGIGSSKLEAICDAAVDLSRVIRQLKDNFWVDNLSTAVGQPISEWNKFADEMASVTACDGKQPGTIAYVIFGALVKNPEENMQKNLVLEKAEVAVYR